MTGLLPKEVDFKPTCDIIISCLDKFFSQSQESSSGMDVFQLIYDLCNARPAPLTESLYQSISEFLKKKAEKAANAILNSQNVLGSYNYEFQVFERATSAVDLVCDYLNKHILHVYRPKQQRIKTAKSNLNEMKTMKALAFDQWRINVWLFIRENHENSLLKCLLEALKNERNGLEIDKNSVATTIESLLVIDKEIGNGSAIYITDFENQFSNMTSDYYQVEAMNKLKNSTVSEFMTAALNRVQQESDYYKKFSVKLDQTESKTIGIVVEKYIRNHRNVIESSFKAMLEAESIKDCYKAFQFLGLIENGYSVLVRIYEDFIFSTLKLELESIDLKDPNQLITKILAIHLKFTEFSTKSFESSQLFIASLDKALQKVVNESRYRSPESFSKYCDLLLRKKDNLDSIEEQLTKAVEMFKYIHDKDVFQKYYSRLLAKRLINSTFSSMDLESLVIRCLKIHCGNEFTSKLQRMFTDMSLCDDLNVEFQQFLQKNSLNSQMTVQVLTAGSWPISLQSKIPSLVPPLISKGLDLFNTMYTARHVGRKLGWQYSLFRVDLKSSGFDKKYEFNTTLGQCIVLLAFSEFNSMNLELIKEKTLIPAVELESILGSLVNSQLLVADNTNFKLNSRFTSKKFKIKLNQQQSATEAAQEDEQVKKSVTEDRSMFLQATIVRIMKSKQQLSHNSLVTQVIECCKTRFQPDIQLIKKTIEHLIERDYLSRSESSTDVYVYSA